MIYIQLRFIPGILRIYFSYAGHICIYGYKSSNHQYFASQYFEEHFSNDFLCPKIRVPFPLAENCVVHAISQCYRSILYTNIVDIYVLGNFGGYACLWVVELKVRDLCPQSALYCRAGPGCCRPGTKHSNVM